MFGLVDGNNFYSTCRHVFQLALRGVIVLNWLKPVGDTVEPRGLDAEPVSAAPATRPSPPITAANAVQIVGLLP